MTERIRKYLWTVLAALTLLLPAAAAAVEIGEYDIKSGMLYNFTHFVEWPSDTSPRSSITICIAGKNQENRSFSRLQGKQHKNQTITVREIRDPGEVSGCNVLFLHRSESRQLDSYLQQTRKRAVLTVSDMEGFAIRGGMIGFIEAGGRIRFEINPDAARQAKIRINSQLLKLARIVSGQ